MYLHTRLQAALLHKAIGDQLTCVFVNNGLLRKGEAEYRELDLARDSLGDDALIEAMATHPRLIERPIVLANGRARIGRPPEAVLEILAP